MNLNWNFQNLKEVYFDQYGKWKNIWKMMI